MVQTLKNNSYHVLGLDTSASQREILKRSKEIVNRLKIDDFPTYDLDLDIFENFRTEELVKEAVQKLSVPKKRIKEYFFWFQIADSVDKQAAGLLKNKNYAEASRVWEYNSYNSDKDTAKALLYKKNLAILHCLLLFKKNSKTNLVQSLKLWKELLASEKFWRAFTEVYKLYDELGTSQEIIDEFKTHAISYVADIYTELGQFHNDNAFVVESSKILEAKGAAIEEAVLSPIYQGVAEVVDKLESMKVGEDGKIDEEESQTLKVLIGKLQEAFNKLIELGFYEDSQSKVLRDRAAEAIRLLSLDIHNNLHELEMALYLSEIAEKISGTAGLKSKLDKDRETIKQNIEDEKKNPMGRCWFCQSYIKNQDFSIREKMYRVTKTEQTFFGRRIHYQQFELTIPRCARCANFHKENDDKFLSIGIGAGIVGGIVISVLADFSFWHSVITSIILAFIGIAIFGAIGKRCSNKTTKSENYKKHFPFYKELRGNGWQPGEKPSG